MTAAALSANVRKTPHDSAGESRPISSPVAEWISVEKRYRNGTHALKGLSCSVASGEIVVLVGPNGSGKTTAMGMASGLCTPTRGTIRVLGQEVRPGHARIGLGVQLQEAGLPLHLRTKEAVASVSCLYRDPGPVDDIIRDLGLEPYMNSMIDSLSGGWQRRLDVALACIGNPRVLVLDEPTSGIDPVARGELWSCLRRLRSRGVGILVSTHDLGEAEAFADRLLVLNKGRLVLSGPVENVLSQAGGNWRIHLTGAGSGLAAFSDGDAPRFYVNGDSATAIGPKAAILRLSERLEQAHSTGGLPYQDILKGPIRLEDVFAYVVAKGESDV